MAEEKMDQNPEEEVEVKDMSGEESPNSQTTDCIQAYIENPIDGLIEAANSQETIACIDYQGKITVQEFNLCMLLKSKNIHQEYFGIKNCISTTFLGQACLIDANVDIYLAKTTAISEALDSSLNAIKESKSKLWEIREAACKLDGARNDSCNSEQLSAMSKIPTGDPDGKKGIARFQALVDGLITDANNLYDAVDDTFEKGVKVAGIQAYMNTGTLKEMSSVLKVDATGFDTDVNDNLSYADEKISSAQTTYTEGLQQLDTCLFARDTSHLEHSSLEAVKTYAEDLESADCEDNTDDLDEICDGIKDIFQEDINC